MRYLLTISFITTDTAPFHTAISVPTAIINKAINKNACINGLLWLTIKSGKASSGLAKFGITTLESIVASTTNAYKITTKNMLIIMAVKAILSLLAENALCAYEGNPININVICKPHVKAIGKFTSVSQTGAIESNFGS